MAGAPFTATGSRVEVRPPSRDDAASYVEAVRRSARRLSDFAVPDPHNLPAVLAAQSSTHRTFMVWALDPQGDHGLVGRVNVSNVVAGAFRSATIGYDAYDPYAGQGLFAEGLRLVVDLGFADEPRGMGLHRIEANVQPANTRSAGLVRSLGFVHEGFSRGFLHLPGVDGRRSWRDHDRYAVLSSDWPAGRYRPHTGRRMGCVVLGQPGAEGDGLGPPLAAELAVPLFSQRTVADVETLFRLLADSPVGGVVECDAAPAAVRDGLSRAGLDPERVPVVAAAQAPQPRDVTRLALSVRAAAA